MKQQRHKHKESFSILLISNMGQNSKAFHISLFVCRLLIIFLLLLIAAVGVLSYLFYTGYGEQEAMQAKFDSQTQLVSQLEEENEKLNKEKTSLAEKNDALQKTLDAAEKESTEQTSDAKPDPSIPSRYPCIGSGLMATGYSEEHNYLSITIQSEGQIIAAGNGTVTSVGSDDNYPVIVELDHGNGYTTRYMCLQESDVTAAENTQVQTGDVLFTVNTDNAQLDYQILQNGEPIDPLTIIEAKG